MKIADIYKAYVDIRTTNNTIPDEVLDFMKEAAIEKLNSASNTSDNGKGEGNWISVERELPKEGEQVLILNYRELDGEKQIGLSKLPFVNTNYWKVTHWLRIPETPLLFKK